MPGGRAIQAAIIGILLIATACGRANPPDASNVELTPERPRMLHFALPAESPSTSDMTPSTESSSSTTVPCATKLVSAGLALLSPTGRYVAFSLYQDGPLYLKDLTTGCAHLVSVTLDGARANAYPDGISADGRYVLFTSGSSSLVEGDTNKKRDAFMRDMQEDRTIRVSVSSSEAQGDGASSAASMSADARFVAFSSDASNLFDGDTNETTDAFVRDLDTGKTSLVSVSSDGAQADRGASPVSVSDDGRYVLLDSTATNLDSSVTPEVVGGSHAYVRDLVAKTTRMVDVSDDGTPGDEQTGTLGMSADGRFVHFRSDSSNLTSQRDLDNCPAGGLDYCLDLYVHDRGTGRTLLASPNFDGADTMYPPLESAMSRSGQFVVFDSFADGYAKDATPCPRREVCHYWYLWNRLTGSTESLPIDTALKALGSVAGLSQDGRFILVGEWSGEIQSFYRFDRETGSTKHINVI